MMKCPKCGTPLREDELYCEKCGHEIVMVPEYDTELEHNIMESIEKIAADFSDDIRQVTHELPAKYGNRRYIKRFLWLLLLPLFVAGILLYQYHSYEYQLNRAERAIKSTEYAEAVRCYERALKLDATKPELFLALADACRLAGDKEDYLEVLKELLQHSELTMELESEVFDRIVPEYELQGHYQAVSNVLQLTEREDIKKKYQQYLAEPPVFSYEEGSYQKVIPLKMVTLTMGKIYYTLDGSEPTQNSMVYTAPILLEGPVITVKAIAVNQYGVSSKVVTATYQINTNYDDEN